MWSSGSTPTWTVSCPSPRRATWRRIWRSAANAPRATTPSWHCAPESPLRRRITGPTRHCADGYGRRRHFINVYLWPADRGATGGPSALTRQGYHLRHWTTPAFVYWVVSDLGTAELDQFAGLLNGADAAAP